MKYRNKVFHLYAAALYPFNIQHSVAQLIYCNWWTIFIILLLFKNMHSAKTEKILSWVVRLGAYILPFTVLYVSNGLFFPFITGKNFAFRIIVEVMAAAWAGLLIINFKKYWPRWNFVSTAFTIFVAAIFLSAVFGADFNSSFWSNFERMEGLVTHIHLLLLFFILTGTLCTKKEWFILFGASIAASVLVAFYGLLEATGEIESLADSPRIISTLGNPLYVAAYLSFHIFLSIFLWFQARSVFFKWLLAGVFLFELAVFFLTGARGAFIGMIIGFGVILLSSFFVFRDAKKRFILGGLIVVLLLMPVLLGVFKNSAFVQGNDLLARFANISFEAGKARLTLWRMGFEAFKERPILGWGIGNFNIPYAKYYDPKMIGQEAWFDRVHNMPLEWLITGGFVVFLAYLALLGSILWALAQGVESALLDKRSASIFIGMFIAYLIQLFFVFDTLSTYLLSTLMLGFFYASSSSCDSRLQKPTIADAGGAKTENKDMRVFKLSPFRIAGIIGAFGAAAVFIATINVRPIMAAQTLIRGLRVFGPDQAVQTKKYFEEALSLARGTIGVSEIREHLAINFLNFSSAPQNLQKPEVGDLYRFALEEMEKQVNGEAGKNINIKHNILLAQLYGMLRIFSGNKAAFEYSVAQYEKVIAFAPRYVYVYPVFANMLAQTGNFERAIDLIDRAEGFLIGAGRFDPQIFYSKPLFYTATRQYDEAYAALRDLSVQYGGPDRRLDSEMMENIILTTRSHEKIKAIPFLEKVYLLDKTVLSVPLMLAQFYAASGDSPGARFYASEALKLDPSISEQVTGFLKALDKVDSHP